MLVKHVSRFFATADRVDRSNHAGLAGLLPCSIPSTAAWAAVAVVLIGGGVPGLGGCGRGEPVVFLRFSRITRSQASTPQICRDSPPDSFIFDELAVSWLANSLVDSR